MKGYERNICEKLIEVKLMVIEGVSVSEVFRVFKDYSSRSDWVEKEMHGKQMR